MANVDKIQLVAYRIVRLLRLNVISMHVIVIFEWANWFVGFVSQIEINGRLDHLRDGHR